MSFNCIQSKNTFTSKAEAEEWLNRRFPDVYSEKGHYSIEIAIMVPQPYHILVREWDVVEDAATAVSGMILENYCFFLVRGISDVYRRDALDMLVRFHGIVAVMDVLRYINFYMPTAVELSVLPPTISFQMRYNLAKSIPWDQKHLLANPVNYRAYYSHLSTDIKKPTPDENDLACAESQSLPQASPQASPQACGSSPQACERSGDPVALRSSGDSVPKRPRLATLADMFQGAAEEAANRAVENQPKPEPLKKYLKTRDFHLRTYGFHIGLPEKQAMTALRKAVAAVGIKKVVDKLQFLLEVYCNNTKAYESLQRDLALITREEESKRV